MKKFFAALLCAGLIAVFAAGCGYSDALDSQVSETQATNSESSSNSEKKTEVKDSDFKDSLDGLCKYFDKLGYIEYKDDKTTVMDASLIGAKEGKKFTSTYNNKQVTIELYAYDIEKLNETANDVIASVKKDGTFSILELPPVKAYLSDNGKYLMVYTDAGIDDANPDKDSDNYKHREEVITNFKEFHK